MWIRAGGGGQPMWIIFKFKILLKNRPTWIRGGGKKLIHKMWIKICVFSETLSNINIVASHSNISALGPTVQYCSKSAILLFRLQGRNFPSTKSLSKTF